MERLSLERVIEIHQRMLRLHSEDPLEGPPKTGCVESALGAACNALMYEEQEQSALHFACYAFFYLARNQCFADGNKRVAFGVLCDLLLHDGLVIQATDDEATEFTLDVADGRIRTVQGVLTWLVEEGRLAPAPFA